MGLSKAEPARWFQANLTVQKKSLFYKFHKTTCAWKGDTRVLNILAWLNNLWSPWPAATAAKGWLQFRAAVLSRMGTVKGTSQQHSEGTKKSQFTQKDKILGGMNPIMLLTREVIGFFFVIVHAIKARNNILGTLWLQPVHWYLIYLGTGY